MPLAAQRKRPGRAPGPEKERYVIYVPPDLGELLRRHKEKNRGATYSDLVEKALRLLLHRQLAAMHKPRSDD